MFDICRAEALESLKSLTCLILKLVSQQLHLQLFAALNIYIELEIMAVQPLKIWRWSDVWQVMDQRLVILLDPGAVTGLSWLDPGEDQRLIG